MDIQTEKLKLIELLLHTNNPSTIEKLKSVYQTDEGLDFWEELSDKQKIEIDRAIDEVKKNKTVPFETFLKKNI